MDSKRVKLQDLGTTPGPEVKEVNQFDFRDAWPNKPKSKKSTATI